MAPLLPHNQHFLDEERQREQWRAADSKLLDLQKQEASLDTRITTLESEVAWIAPTLQNSWVNYGSGYIDAGYRKRVDGVVELRGLVKNGSGIPTVVFTLPSGYRPSGLINFPVVSASAFGAIAIDSSGNVTIFAGSTVNLSLNGILFSTN